MIRTAAVAASNLILSSPSSIATCCLRIGAARTAQEEAPRNACRTGLSTRAERRLYLHIRQIVFVHTLPPTRFTPRGRIVALVHRRLFECALVAVDHVASLADFVVKHLPRQRMVFLTDTKEAAE